MKAVRAQCVCDKWRTSRHEKMGTSLEHTLEVLVAMIEEHNSYIPSVILIYYPCPCVYEVLSRESRAWSNPGISAMRDGD